MFLKEAGSAPLYMNSGCPTRFTSTLSMTSVRGRCTGTASTQVPLNDGLYQGAT